MVMDHEYSPSNVPPIRIDGKESPFSDVVSLIEHFRKGMSVIGVLSVENLDSFLNGFAFAKANSGQTDDLEYLNKFNIWVRERFKVTTSQGWGKVITFFTMSDSEGISLFWKRYDEYLGERKGRRKGAGSH